jgi:Trk K+ transport system NAD-binding subunit
MREFDLYSNSPCLNKTLAEIKFPAGVRVMMIRRNQSFLLPKGDTQLLLNDGLLVMGDKNSIRELLEKFLPGNNFYEEEEADNMLLSRSFYE